MSTSLVLDLPEIGRLHERHPGISPEHSAFMAGAAAVAQQGITAETFPVGTIFSVKVNPLRDGNTYGSRIGAIASSAR